MSRETWVVVTDKKTGKISLVNRAAHVRPRAGGLQVIKDIEPYKNIAVDGKIIKSRREHRDMLRAHGLIELGNEKHTAPKPPPVKVDMSCINAIKRAMGKL